MSEMPGISNPDDFPVAEKYHDLLDDPEIITQLFRLERIRKKNDRADGNTYAER